MYPATDLKSTRLQKGLTQEDLARNLLGIRPATINALENGQSVPKRKTRERIESILGPVDWRLTLAAGDRGHLLYSMTELINEGEGGDVRGRIKFAKQILVMLDETLNT